MKSCLICDDHALVREAVVGTIRLGWPAVAVSEAGDFPAAWAVCRAATPPFDLCLADLMMPGADPLTGIAGLMRAAPAMPILVITGTQDDALLVELITMGVAGFAAKTSSGKIIDAAIRLILAGGRYLPPRMADLAAGYADAGRRTAMRDRDGSVGDPPHLTGRQRDVLRLMEQGLSTKDIARTLGLAPSTVKTHLSQIFLILGATNRTEASQLARTLIGR